MHWGDSSVSFVIDPSVEAAVPGGSAAVASAVSAWSGVGGAPALSSSVGPGDAVPQFDRQNSVIYMRHGSSLAGHALAVTVSTIEDDNGELLDTDIVINGQHPFAVLAAGTVDPGATPMSTDGASEGGDGSGSFDLQHVVAHEVGHAMGLADVHDDQAALMYAMSAPGSAANRAPTSDDEAGVEQLYAGGFPAASSQGGCGQATIAGAHAHAGPVWLGFVALAAAATWVGSRKGRRLVLPALASGALLLAGAEAPPASGEPAPATARVVAVSTQEVSGVLQTQVDLVPVSCAASCPAHARALVWGGTRGGITQKVDGAPIPRVGDTLDVTYTPGLDPVAVVHARAS